VLADTFDVFLLDLDGVVYAGRDPLPGAPEALARLRGMGKRLRFLTNDPRPTRRQVARRLRAMGIAAHVREVVTAGWATARYLRQRGAASAYVLGSPGLVAELRRAGIEIVDQDQPQAVVVGCDERVGYAHLRRAVTCILHGASFVATNDDSSFPTREGPWPATGALVAAVRAASGRRPTIVGKPSGLMFASATEGLDPRVRVAVVGDSPTTDILGAHQAGLTGILVAPRPVHFPSPRDFRSPDTVIPDLAGLFDPAVPLRRWDAPGFPWPDHVRPGVAAVVLDAAGRVLLARRADNGLWGLPSGHVEPGETVVEAVAREVREETGLDVRVLRLVGLYSDPASQVFAYPDGRVTHFITACFACAVAGGDVCCDGVEALEAAYFAPESLPPDLLPMHPQWLTDALAAQATAFVR
jgi:HAD superfamily hydrolase (TIGR01450 family)